MEAWTHGNVEGGRVPGAGASCCVPADAARLLIPSPQMAMRISAQPSAVLYSNRSAAYTGMAYFGRALEDADAAIGLDPR